MKLIRNQEINVSDIPAFVIALAIEHAQENGVNAERILAGSGLNFADISNAGVLVSYRQATSIIRRIIRYLPDGPTGLVVGTKGALGSFGILGVAMLSSSNIREAVAVGLAHHKAAGSLMDVSAEYCENDFSLILHERFPTPDILPFLCEEVLASIIGLLRLALGEHAAPLRVELSYAEPFYAEAYRRFFNCPVHFLCETSRIVLDAAILEIPLLTASPTILAASLKASAQHLPVAEPMSDLVTSVERALRGNLRQRPTMKCVADTLNLTERTLRRGLTAAGQSFSSIRDNLLEQQANILLDRSGLSIAAISAELGFSDAREFSRAFQRWTGEAPSRRRKELPDATSDADVL